MVDASYRLAPNWVPATQPRLQQRMRWLEDVLPLAELYAIRADPDRVPALSSIYSSSDPLASSLRAFFANYTRFHAGPCAASAPTPSSSSLSLARTGSRAWAIVYWQWCRDCCWRPSPIACL